MDRATSSYFQVALRTFTDNLINLAIEICLIQDLRSLFTLRLVSEMDYEKLAQFAAKVRNYCSQLLDGIKILQEGLEQCRRYRPRETTKGKCIILKHF